MKIYSFNLMLFFLGLVLLMTSCTTSSHSKRSPSPSDQTAALKENKQEIDSSIKPPSSLVKFNVGKTQYIFYKNGIGEKHLSGGTVQSFRLPIDRYDTIQNLQSFTHENQLGVLYDFTDGASSAATLIYLDQSSLEALWTLELPTYHIGPVLFSFPFYYVTAKGFIGKIDLRTGDLLWKHDELYRPEKGGIDQFSQPERNGDLIEFSKKNSDVPFLIQVDDLTGEILEIIK